MTKQERFVGREQKQPGTFVDRVKENPKLMAGINAHKFQAAARFGRLKSNVMSSTNLGALESWVRGVFQEIQLGQPQFGWCKNPVE